jgi:hypothetical protein
MADKRFFVATNEMPTGMRDALTTYIKRQEWSYWHWFSEFWIISGVPHGYTAKSLYGELESNAGPLGKTLIILEIPDGDIRYWGLASESTWTWMNNYLNR